MSEPLLECVDLQKAFGAPPKNATWVKSRIGSKLWVLFIAGPSTWVGMPETISV